MLSINFLCSLCLNCFTVKLFYGVLSNHFTWTKDFGSTQLLSYILNFSADVSIQVSTAYIIQFSSIIFYSSPNRSLMFNPSVFSSAPPSAPVSVTWEYESGDGGVSLRWRPPVEMGGRTEVWYGVVCRICPSPTFTNPAACSWCGEGVTFSPSKTNLKQTKVTLNNLLTRVTYLIQVLWKKGEILLLLMILPKKV